MITLASPISVARSIVGFTVLGYSDRPNIDVPGNGTVSANVRLHYSDGTYEDTAYTLWDGPTYAESGQWTDSTAQARVAEVIAGK